MCAPPETRLGPPGTRLRPVRLALIALFAPSLLLAADPDPIGLSLIRQIHPTLTGSGVKVAQPESTLSLTGNDWEVNPAAVGQLENLFTWTSLLGVATNFPNLAGFESWHADSVGGLFYGTQVGVAPGVSHVFAYEAEYFYNTVVLGSLSIPPRIVNQSFIFDGVDVSQQRDIDSNYDNFAARYHTLFLSGAGNGGPVSPPSTCYNGLSVGTYDGPSSTGPTLDNGRAKPDLTAPGGFTSFSTPLVAGAAAILAQAGSQDEGGPGTASAAMDSRSIKALLLNSAVKPTNWFQPAGSPLDTRYGAGILNIFNAHAQLAAGKHSFADSTSITLSSPHPPTTATNAILLSRGWDFDSLSSTMTHDRVNHYVLDVSTNGGPSSVLTATLVWNRQENETNINNLDLYLYDTSNSNLVASSTSAVDNVEQIFVRALPPGQYDLQVLKRGGPDRVSAAESYALVFDTSATPLAIEEAGGEAVLSWPIYPAGFALESTTNVTVADSWSFISATPVVTNGMNRVSLPATGGRLFFRLRTR